MRLKDKVIIITGAARGIGKACAERLSREGAKVVVSDIDEADGEKLAEAIQERGGDAIFRRCDVGDAKEANELVAAAVAAFGRLDGLVANAGIVHAADFLDFSEEDFDRVLRVNLKGVFLTGQAAARQMAKQGPGPDGAAGAIVNMSSVNAVMAIPSITPYVVAKGGVNQLTKVMALALADKGIRVNAIGPGTIETDLYHAVANDPEKRRAVMSRTPMGRPGSPDEVAKVAVFLLSDDSSYMTGQIIYPDGGRMALNYVVPVED